MNKQRRHSMADKIQTVPKAPGVYVYKDAGGDIIYIGKAVNLRNRVRSYFQSSRHLDPKTAHLVEEIADLEFIVTSNEYEAFLLESNLVHEHRPRYNIFLKDDKSFPFIRLTIHEEYPRISLTRRPVKDGSRYFGPFIPASRARHLIDTVRKFFGIRHCRQVIDGNAERPCCLDYHIHRCLAPCVAAICSRERYRQAVEEAVMFLDGRNRELTERLEREMDRLSGQQLYEDAALVRDRLAAVRSLAETQQVIMTGEDDVDIFAFFAQDARLAVQVFHLRGAKVVDREQFFWEDRELQDPGGFFRDFLQQFYVSRQVVPAQVFLPLETVDTALLERWLSEKRGRKVRILHPQRGQRARLVRLAERNARLAYFARFAGLQSGMDVLVGLQSALGLEGLPLRIEAFDISNTQGNEVVASMVTAIGGRMDRGRYRRFRIRTVTGSPDDFAAMREVVHRRYSRLLEEGGELPSLVMVDGGAGQVSAARESLRRLGLDNQPLCGLAKQEELIFMPDRKEPIRLERTAPELKFLQQIRDEAHRFAVTYHRQRRGSRSLASRLDAIPGIGPHRKKRLLQHFGSWPKIMQAEALEFRKILGARTGDKIYQLLHETERN